MGKGGQVKIAAGETNGMGGMQGTVWKLSAM